MYKSFISRHGKKRSDTPQYLDDRLDLKFVGIIRGVWDYPKKRRPKILELDEKYGDVTFIALKKRREINGFVE